MLCWSNLFESPRLRISNTYDAIRMLVERDSMYNKWTRELDVSVADSTKVDVIQRGGAVREDQSLSCGWSRGY